MTELKPEITHESLKVLAEELHRLHKLIDENVCNDFNDKHYQYWLRQREEIMRLFYPRYFIKTGEN